MAVSEELYRAVRQPGLKCSECGSDAWRDKVNPTCVEEGFLCYECAGRYGAEARAEAACVADSRMGVRLSDVQAQELQDVGVLGVPVHAEYVEKSQPGTIVKVCGVDLYAIFLGIASVDNGPRKRWFKKISSQ